MTNEADLGCDCQVEEQAREPGITDEALAVAAQHDYACFAQLYERYADRLYRYVLGRIRSPETAADIVGDTMADALQHISEFDPGRGGFSTWVFTIANRRILDRQRRYRRWLRFLSTRPPPSQPAYDSVLDFVLNRDEAERVYRALDQLPETNRQIILLRYGGELSSPEIGQILGLSAGAVRMRLQRTLQQLEAILDEGGRDA